MSRRGRRTWRSSLVVMAATAALVGTPPSTPASVTLGQTFAPLGGCGADTTFVQTVSPGSSYSMPSDGVVTSWSFGAGVNPPSQVKLKVARATPGADFNNDVALTITGESGLETPVESTVKSWLTRVPVEAGETLGLYVAAAGRCMALTPGYTHHRFGGDVLKGQTEQFIDAPGQLSVAAVLEPDCDHDTLGDETQDPDISVCRCRGTMATIVGTNRAERLIGTPGRDVIVGLGGKDTLSGLGGKDRICGGTGKDLLRGGKGKDKLFGEAGSDSLRGAGGKDVCKGGRNVDIAVSCEVEKSI